MKLFRRGGGGGREAIRFAAITVIIKAISSSPIALLAIATESILYSRKMKMCVRNVHINI
jgi:hypothetical protein